MAMQNIASLTCGYWNINGHRSKYLGDKLQDKEFLSIISNCDIIGLGEIHSEGNVDIEGYKRVKQKIRDKTFRGPKIAGGIGVFVRNEISHLVELVPNTCEDSIWIKIKGDEIYVGTYYVSPSNSNTNSDFLNSINDEICKFSNKGIAVIQGDLNARTGTENDYLDITYDDEDDPLGKEAGGNKPGRRNSEDKKLNVRGKELLDVCKLNNFIIANGRKPGDIFW